MIRVHQLDFISPDTLRKTFSTMVDVPIQCLKLNGFKNLDDSEIELVCTECYHRH